MSNNNFRRMLWINIILLIVLVGGGFAGYYFYNQSANYLKTDNAKIDGQAVTITPPVAGKLVEWNGEIGKTYSAGDKIGTVETAAGKVDITVPDSVTIVTQSAVKNALVAPGSPLAYAFNLDRLNVTANIKETDINDVKAGQEVDVYVDAFEGTTLKGKISTVGLATANTFSLLPTSNATGNYTKVTQVIPVTITLDGYKGLAIAPGMNVTVRIHK